MKKLSKILIKNSILVFFLFQSIIIKAQCVSGPMSTPAPTGSTVESKNGYYAPTSGTYRALIIFAEVIYSPSSDDPNLNGNSTWLPNTLPTWANDVFNLNVGSSPLKPMTKYFDQASFGQLKLLGDVLINPNNPNGIFQVPLTTNEALSGTQYYSRVFNEVNSSTGGVFRTLNNLNQSDFNAWSATSFGLPKLFPGTENKYDVVFIVWRNRPAYNNNGRMFNGISNLLLGQDINVLIEVGSFDALPMKVMRHEFCHSLFGANNMHTAGEQGYDDDYWVSWPGGYGAMGLHGASLLSWNGWDRQRMGWKPASNAFNPSARNSSNTNEVNGEIDPGIPSQAGDYILRDFVTTGDAIRIKLPFIDHANKYPEYLWIENHQGFSRNGCEFDQFQHQSVPCITSFEPGLYMQLQIDQDVRTSSSTNATNEVFYNGKAFYTYPITAEGFYDEEWETNTQTISCVSWFQTHPFIRNINLPNPFSGTGDQQNPANDIVLNDDQINNYEKNLHEVEKIAGVYQYNLPYLGHSRNEFSLSGNNKLGISTNPSSASLMNLVSYDWPAPIDTKNNESVYLNGVSVEIITEYANGDIKIRIKFDDIDINNDVRWCAPLITLNPISTSTGYSLNIKNGKKITLDQGLTSTKIDMPMMFQGKKVFSSPTNFIANSGANINLEPNSKLIIDNGSSFFLKNNSILNIQSGAEIIVKRGGKLLLESGSKVKLENGAKVIIEDDGFVEYFPSAEIYLNGSSSVFEINGELKLHDNSNFTFYASTANHGYIVFGSNLFPSKNIIAGQNCTINLQGSGINRKMLEIKQETFYAPANLTSLVLNNGMITFHPNSRLQADGLLTGIDLNNCRFTSNSPGINNGHRGIHLYGQGTLLIQSCIFEFGRYGIFAFQTYGGNPLNIINSTFRNNTRGIRAYDKGLGLFQCNFFNNTFGVDASGMSFPSKFFEGITGGNVASSNITGINWQSHSNASLTLENPLINTNHTGVRAVNCPLYVKCGSISYNYDGIVYTYGANLFMNDQVITPNTAANVSMFNNYYSIRPVHAWDLWLNKGGNDLSPSSMNNERTVFGSLDGSTSSIIANTNQWNSSGTFSPLDYNLNGNTITIVDNNIQSSITGCGQAVPPCSNPPCPIQSPLEYCPLCDVINTDYFTGVKLNIATKTALDKLYSNDPDKYKDGIALFCQILNEQYLNPDDKEKYLLSLNYIKMMEALGNAFKYDQIVCLENGLPELMSQVIGIQDLLIANSVSNNNLSQRLKYSLDKAQTLRLACRRTECIELLNEILNWAVGDDEIASVNLFICQVNIEILLMNGEITNDDVEAYLTDCGGSTTRVRNNSEILDQLNPPMQELLVDVYNNSNSGFVEIKTNATKGYLTMLNSIGEVVYETDLIYEVTIDVSSFSEGIYFLNITNTVTSESVVNKIVIN